jgi:hypothetical protein
MRACILVAAMFFTQEVTAQNFLSNLHAAKNDPIFTTYAAPVNRSEFIVDEGYQFVWYDMVRGVNFETDNGGNLCLGWKMNGKLKYYLNEFYREPIIATSYSDLVKYYFYPFEKIRAEIFFLVYSSRIAIQDITITNESDSTAEISLYPFFHHSNDVVTDVGIVPERDGFTFTHQERPDGWTVEHNIPYQENLVDVYVIDTVADAFGGYRALGTKLSLLSTASLSNYCVEWGTVRHADGSLCFHKPPQAQQIIFHNGSLKEILTEDAPKWGNVDPNIPGNGYQGCELGNFQSPPISAGDSFSVLFSCTATAQTGFGKGIIPQLPVPDGVRTDVLLSSMDFLLPPQNVTVQFSQNRASAVVTWEQTAGFTYDVFRCSASTSGRYLIVAEKIIGSGYLDFGLNSDSSYFYTIITRDSTGRMSGHSMEVGNSAAEFFTDANRSSLSNRIGAAGVKVIALQKNYSIPAKQSVHLRIIRGVTEADSSLSELIARCRTFRTLDLNRFILEDELDYSNIPHLSFSNTEYTMLYWNCFSLLRQCILPSEGQLTHNYYVFSREPQWGWGHGGQVFHESLSMLAYAFMDSTRAMNSQRVFIERQHNDGYINYRTGPYLNETIPYNSQLTTSAPWFNWENWEIFQVTKSRLFLIEAYESGEKFYNYWLRNRNADNDGLCEWGGHAVLECVRDGLVAVWDKVGWPSNFECLDLNVMLVSEANSLAEMARELGNVNEYQMWKHESDARRDSINKYMWDAQTEFYYHVDKTDHDFSYHSLNDLKRKEIIGFLPLWAGVATADQAQKLVHHLLDSREFWRTYGIPTLSADDDYYNPTGYWNGPLWVQWQYLIFRGLLRYGYVNEARMLAEKVCSAVIQQLKTNHWFCEMYSPDAEWGGWNKTYIWTGIIARMLIDVNTIVDNIRQVSTNAPQTVTLEQNFPNPSNPATTIQFSISERALVSLRVFDVLGREVKTLVNEVLSAGTHERTWDAQSCSNGVYFYRVQAGSYSNTKKLVLLK